MTECDAERIDLCIQQNATFLKQFTWIGWIYLQGIPTIGPINLTGYTAVMQIRPYPLSPVILYDASSNLLLGGVAGTITLSIPASVTAGFTWWNGVYDLLATSGDGSYTVRLFQGKVSVSPGVTT
jgi:hypothetical protein